MEDRAVLHSIEKERNITQEMDSGFLFEFQKAVLLALVESGRLNEQQYRYAEEKLKSQRRTFAKSGEKCENTDREVKAT